MQDKYYKKNVSKEWLVTNGFRYSKNLSDEDTSVYTYRFPVFKYERMTVLECEINISLEDGKVKLNVYDYRTNDKYAAFYYCEYGNYDKMLKIIWDKIDYMLKKLQIESKTNNE